VVIRVEELNPTRQKSCAFSSTLDRLFMSNPYHLDGDRDGFGTASPAS
jgi:hypothetical protein